MPNHDIDLLKSVVSETKNFLNTTKNFPNRNYRKT